MQLASPVVPRAEEGSEANLAQSLLQRLGMRRTAYPTDMSIGELREHALLVTMPLPGVGQGQPSLSQDEIADALSAGRSVLVIGDPGSGKTVLAYSVGATLLERGTSVPLTIDLGRVLGTPPASRLNSLRRLPALQALPAVMLPSATSRSRFSWTASDEVLASGADDHEVAAALRALGGLGPLLVTCRKLDYERNHAAIPADLFNQRTCRRCRSGGLGPSSVTSRGG